MNASPLLPERTAVYWTNKDWVAKKQIAESVTDLCNKISNRPQQEEFCIHVNGSNIPVMDIDIKEGSGGVCYIAIRTD